MEGTQEIWGEKEKEREKDRVNDKGEKEMFGVEQLSPPSHLFFLLFLSPTFREMGESVHGDALPFFCQ